MRTTAFATIVAVLAPHAAHAGAFEATDKNFDSAVMNSGKHVFAKFLAPWCVFDDARDRERRSVLFLCRVASRGGARDARRETSRRQDGEFGHGLLLSARASATTRSRERRRLAIDGVDED